MEVMPAMLGADAEQRFLIPARFASVDLEDGLAADAALQ
jgi:hypothetical protein